eukprot:m.167414 g.167414  ORF g.167414 m.167414 type:complete len:110 (+) comp14461_c0_seq3:156-485(+)
MQNGQENIPVGLSETRFCVSLGICLLCLCKLTASHFMCGFRYEYRIASPRTALLTAPTNQAPMVPRQSSAANPFGDMEDDMPPPLPFASSKRASAKRTLAISAPDSQSK